jgi:hypothetical protein
MPLSRIHPHRHTSEPMAAASEQPPRPRTADPASRYSFFGTKRSFPLVMRKKTKDGNGSNTTPERPSTSHLLLSTGSTTATTNAPLTRSPSLRVRLFLKFESPLDSAHHAEFQSSPSFEPTDRICQVLLQRLQHCSAELLTRRDCHAMDPHHAQGSQPLDSADYGSGSGSDADAADATGPTRAARPRRFQLTFSVERHGLRWAEETFVSYQQDPVNADLADDILAESRLFVSRFLSRHDPGFPRASSADVDPPATRPETRRPCFGLPQPVSCVPRTQEAPSPGFLIEVFLRSRDQGPGAQRSTSLRIDSQQSSPLTLLLGEDVLSKASRVLDRAFADQKTRFDERHCSCDGVEGTGGCEHIADGAFDALVKIRNNLGPDYNQLSHRLQSCRILFAQQDSYDLDDFASHLREKLGAVRDLADQALNAVDDLSFHIRKLDFNDYSTQGPLYVSLDASITHDRRTTAALLERVQTGICHKIEGTGASVVLTAHKRGHLVLDAHLRDADAPRGKLFDKPRPTVDDLVTRLKDQMRADITMLCKDTCSLVPSDLLQNLRIFDARSAAYNERPSTSGPMLSTEPPSTPTGLSLSKRRGRFDLRQASLSPYETSPSPTDDYMALAPSYDAYLSDSSSTPSLVDTDSISPHDSVLITPEYTRTNQREPLAFGIRLMDDGPLSGRIGTPELIPDSGHPDQREELSAVYESPPFQNPFVLSKASPSEPTVVSSSSEATVVLPTSEVVEAPASVDQTVQEQHTLQDIGLGLVLNKPIGPSSDESIDSSQPEPLDEAGVSEGPSKNDSDTTLKGLDGSAIAKTGPTDEAAATVPTGLSSTCTEVSSPAPSEAPKAAAGTESQKETEPHAEPTTLTAEFLPQNATERPAVPIETPRKTGDSEAKSQEEPEPVMDYIPTVDILPRPSLQGLNERSKSSALILRARPGSSHLDYLPSLGLAQSALRDKQPQRRWSMARPSMLHRRQLSSPTAGFLGLHEEFLVEVGLMNAVIPSHLRSVHQ